jgi:hypothetical protein
MTKTITYLVAREQINDLVRDAQRRRHGAHVRRRHQLRLPHPRLLRSPDMTRRDNLALARSTQPGTPTRTHAHQPQAQARRTVRRCVVDLRRRPALARGKGSPRLHDDVDLVSCGRRVLGDRLGNRVVPDVQERSPSSGGSSLTGSERP